jgi:predicted cupin superfamily sugar epimerase
VRQVGIPAEEIKRLLDLEPHPTCGFVRESFRSEEQIPADALPGFDGPRPRGSVLWFLVTPDARMALHRIRPDQVYHHYLGDPLEVLVLRPDGTGAVETVGSDLAAGLRPQLLIPGQTWHVSRLHESGEYALLATTEWPGVEPPDVEVGDPTRLIDEFPSLAAEIREFSRGAGAQPLR